MQHLFLAPEQFTGETALVIGADHAHLARVLRVTAGDKAVLLDNNGAAYLAAVVSVEKHRTVFRIEAAAQMPAEPAARIVVAQALGKGDKFEQVVQHGVEVGAAEFLPVCAERCVVAMSMQGDRSAARIARWNAIAKSAAEQCGRSRIPEVRGPVRSADLFRAGALSSGMLQSLKLILHPGGDSLSWREALRGGSMADGVVVAVGPEGGWSAAEVSAARDSGWIPVSLGSYTLRTETAALVAVSRIVFQLEE